MPTLYKVDESWESKNLPKLHSVEVTLSKNGKMYRVNKGVRAGLPFGCRSRFDVGDHAETPKDAWVHYKARQEDAMAQAKRDFVDAERNLRFAIAALTNIVLAKL